MFIRGKIASKYKTRVPKVFPSRHITILTRSRITIIDNVKKNNYRLKISQKQFFIGLNVLLGNYKIFLMYRYWYFDLRTFFFFHFVSIFNRFLLKQIKSDVGALREEKISSEKCGYSAKGGFQFIPLKQFERTVVKWEKININVSTKINPLQPLWPPLLLGEDLTPCHKRYFFLSSRSFFYIKINYQDPPPAGTWKEPKTIPAIVIDTPTIPHSDS